MSMKITAIALLGLVSITACSGMKTTTATAPAAPAAPAKPALNDEAKAALAQAIADIKKAKDARALWTSADAAMKSAQKAADAGDSATVIKNAKFVANQTALGLAQKAYPSTEQ
jgi:flagellar basal body L-ring protein FlgH